MAVRLRAKQMEANRQGGPCACGLKGPHGLPAVTGDTQSLHFTLPSRDPQLVADQVAGPQTGTCAQIHHI